jgi:hypothetical protein
MREKAAYVDGRQADNCGASCDKQDTTENSRKWARSTSKSRCKVGSLSFLLLPLVTFDVGEAAEISHYQRIGRTHQSATLHGERYEVAAASVYIARLESGRYVLGELVR